MLFELLESHTVFDEIVHENDGLGFEVSVETVRIIWFDRVNREDKFHHLSKDVEIFTTKTRLRCLFFNRTKLEISEFIEASMVANVGQKVAFVNEFDGSEILEYTKHLFAKLFDALFIDFIKHISEQCLIILPNKNIIVLLDNSIIMFYYMN